MTDDSKTLDNVVQLSEKSVRGHIDEFEYGLTEAGGLGQYQSDDGGH